MTDILKLAEQAGIPFNKYGLVGCDTCETDIDDALQCFADLIRADERQRLIGASVVYGWARTATTGLTHLQSKLAQVEKDVIERCAKVCDEVAAKYQREHYATAENVADECAAAIRGAKP